MRRALCIVLALGAALAACGGGGSERSSADRFFAEFVADDGRVVRHDQGGDTVSEGQAYAMLVAVAGGDEQRFDRVWRWTRRHLEREDGLLAWRWKGGRVADRQPAADADLDVADALTRAAARFDRPELREQARRITRAIQARETVDGVLVAGPWATSERVLNPGYISPGTLRSVGLEREADAGLSALKRLLGRQRLPPDWARFDGKAVWPSAPPGKRDEALYGYDAVRLPLRLSATCDERARALAAELWPALQDQPGVLPRGLDGTPRGDKSPVGLVAAAGAARAAGEDAQAERLLDEADELEEQQPTYFGSALVALARTAWKPPRGC